jgi:tRNA dimethylallyltransferase
VVVSADSRQLFHEMNIGTAKPSAAELATVPHFFINHLSLSEPYSAGRYAHECYTLLEQLFTKHDVVFLVGGSGLYIRAVIEGFDMMPMVDPEIRERWEKIYETQGLPVLQEALRNQDPDFVPHVDMQNPRRLVRALSLIEASGKRITELRKQVRSQLPFHVIRVFCNLPRKELYARIHARVDAMIEAGLVDEVKSLLEFRDTQAMQTVGYKELVEYFDGKVTLEGAIGKIKQHSCNYAKRQITWFRNQGDWKEFKPPDVDEIERYIESRSLPAGRQENENQHNT